MITYPMKYRYVPGKGYERKQAAPTPAPAPAKKPYPEGPDLTLENTPPGEYLKAWNFYLAKLEQSKTK